MRKLIFIFVILSVLITTVSAAGTVFTQDAPSPDNTEALEVVYNEVEIDTAASTVKNRLLLHNTSEQTVSFQTKLPMSEVRANTLCITLDGKTVSAKDGAIRQEIGADSYQTLYFSYETISSLHNAKVVSYDLTHLDYGEGKHIGKLSVTIRFPEEDVPLVKTLEPPNYTYNCDDFSVNFTMYDFPVTSLLHQIVVTKDTYIDLLCGSTLELSDQQRDFLTRCKDWFRDGLPLTYEAWGADRDATLFALCDHDESDYEFTSNLFKGYDDRRPLESIYDYLFLREVTSKHLPSSYYNMNPAPLLNEFAAQKLSEQYDTATPKDPLVFCVEYMDEPSLQNTQLYVSQPVYNEDSCYIADHYKYRPISEYAALHTETSLSHCYSPFCRNRIRFAFLDHNEITSPEELAEYMHAIGAKMYIRQALYDARDGSYPPVSTYGAFADYGSGAIGYAGEQNEEAAKIFYSRYDSQVRRLRELPDDMTLLALDEQNIPAFVQYRGVVLHKDGLDYVEYFESGYYDCADRGVSLYDSDLAETDRIRQMEKARQEKDAAAKDAVEAVLTRVYSPGQPQETQMQETEVPTSAVPETEHSEQSGKTGLTPILLAGFGTVLIALCIICNVKKRKERSE